MHQVFENKVLLFIFILFVISSGLIFLFCLISGKDKIFPKVFVPGTEIRTIRSHNTGSTYEIYIYLPDTYKISEKKYPVIYVLDAQWNFNLVHAIVKALQYDNYLPEVIIAGITYSGKNPDYTFLRMKDFTPTRIEGFNSGGAPEFLSFIKDELVPFMNSMYAVSEDRTLVGASLGGLFTLYTMLQDPGFFSRQVAASPALFWDKGFLFKELEKFSSTHTSLKENLFLSMGGQEDTFLWVGMFQKFVHQLERKDFQNLEMDSMIIPGERHSCVTAEAFNRGLRSVFPKTVTECEVEEYVGNYTYALYGAFPVTCKIKKEGHRLLVTSSFDLGTETFELYASQPDHFFRKDAASELIFTRDNTGRVDGFTIYINKYEKFPAVKK